MSKKNNRLGKLISGGSSNTTLSKSDNQILFNDLVFMEAISVYFDENNVELNIEVITYNNKTVKLIEASKTENSRTFHVCKFIKRINLKDKLPFYKSIGVSKIVLVGMDGEALKSFENETLAIRNKMDSFESNALKQINSINNRSNELISLEANYDVNVSKYDELTETIEGHKGDLESLLEEQDRVNEGISNSKSEFNIQANVLQNTEDMISQKNKEVDSINNGILSLKDRLRGLENDVNAYSDEFITYRKESKANVKTYSLYALLCIAGIMILVIRMYFLSEHLFTNGISWNDALSSFVSRLPFAFVVALIIWTLSGTAKTFITKIIEINKRTMELSQLLIIAKDVSGSQTKGLQLSDEEISDKRIYLKMDMLKSYLRNVLDKSYEYQALQPLEKNDGDDDKYTVEVEDE